MDRSTSSKLSRGGVAARSAGVAQSVPTSPFLPTVSRPQVRLSAVCRDSLPRPSGASYWCCTTPRQGRAGGGAWEGWARSSWP
jgi:hypothetical protein